MSGVVERVRVVEGVRRVAGYLATRGELDLRPALAELIANDIEIVLPVCGDDLSLEFCPWRPGDVMGTGPYGIEEPLTAPVELRTIDVVLVPGVGFDDAGSRIGHGAGYYDRFFARCFALEHDPRRLGIAHDLQLVTLPEPEPWDVAMHEIITPTKVLHVSK